MEEIQLTLEGGQKKQSEGRFVSIAFYPPEHDMIAVEYTLRPLRVDIGGAPLLEAYSAMLSSGGLCVPLIGNGVLLVQPDTLCSCAIEQLVTSLGSQAVLPQVSVQIFQDEVRREIDLTRASLDGNYAQALSAIAAYRDFATQHKSSVETGIVVFETRWLPSLGSFVQHILRDVEAEVDQAEFDKFIKYLTSSGFAGGGPPPTVVQATLMIEFLNKTGGKRERQGAIRVQMMKLDPEPMVERRPIVYTRRPRKLVTDSVSLETTPIDPKPEVTSHETSTQTENNPKEARQEAGVQHELDQMTKETETDSASCGKDAGCQTTPTVQKTQKPNPQAGTFNFMKPLPYNPQTRIRNNKAGAQKAAKK